MLADAENGCLFGHVSNSNPQLKDLCDADDCVCVFNGPHAYISPSYYASKNQVPTWNYETVEVHCTAELLSADALTDVLERLSAKHESNMPEPWKLADDLTENKYQISSKAITAFRLNVRSMHGVCKMNQHKGEADHHAVVSALREIGDDNSVGVADIMDSERKNK